MFSFPYLTAEPVEGNDIPARELARHLEEHGVHEGHPAVNGRAAEGVLGLQRQPDVFDHVCQEFKVVQVTQGVHRVVQSAKERLVKNSAVDSDPDQKGSEPYCRIRIRIPKLVQIRS